MRDIAANHLSLVVAGRAGQLCSLAAYEHPDERGWRQIETACGRAVEAAARLCRPSRNMAHRMVCLKNYLMTP
jgi:hypothetical protein